MNASIGRCSAPKGERRVYHRGHKGGPMGAVESPQFFLDSMELMNFEHGLQSD
jgi:hypothetical protein